MSKQSWGYKMQIVTTQYFYVCSIIGFRDQEIGCLLHTHTHTHTHTHILYINIVSWIDAIPYPGCDEGARMWVLTHMTTERLCRLNSWSK